MTAATARAGVPEDRVIDFDIHDPGLAMPVDHYQSKAAELREIGRGCVCTPITFTPTDD